MPSPDRNHLKLNEGHHDEDADVSSSSSSLEAGVTTARSANAASSRTAGSTITSSPSSSNRYSHASLTARVLSGSIGSIVTSLVVTPLDVVKVRMQANLMPAAATATTTTTAAAATVPSNVVPCPRGCGTFVLFNGHMECILPKSCVPYFQQQQQQHQSTSMTRAATPAATTTRAKLGTFSMLRRIFVQEGFTGLYAGLRPTLFMAVPNTVLYFSAYEEIVWQLRSHSESSWPSPFDASNGFLNGWTIPMIAGASSRLVASSITAPFEFLRTRQAIRIGEQEFTTEASASATTAATTTRSTGMFRELNTIIRQEGVLTLFRGLQPTLWRDIPFSAIYWLCLEQFREQWKRREHGAPRSPLQEAEQAFVNGAAAGMIAAACTTPFDVVKTRNQAIPQSLSAMETVMWMPAVSTSPATTKVAVTQTSALPSSRSRPLPSPELCTHNGAVAYYPPRSSLLSSTATSSSLSSPSRYVPSSVGTLAQIQHIARTEGIMALWTGNQARMLKVAPACAIMISCYEFGKRIFEDDLERI